MKTLPLAALAALAAITITLLAGCAEPQTSASALTPASHNDEPIVIDLTRQVMNIPSDQFGYVDVPILASGNVVPGSAVIDAEPSDAVPYEHCEDRTVAWAAESGSQPLQFVTFDPACTDVATIHGRAVMVPRTVTEHEGEYGTVDQWLTADRGIVIVGKSPHPIPGEAPITDPDLKMPDERHTFLGSIDYHERSDSI